MCNQLGLTADKEDALGSDISARRVVQDLVPSSTEVDFFFSGRYTEDESRKIRIFCSLRLDSERP